MASKNTNRHDPLYRVIDETTVMKDVEGKYNRFFNRLKGINSLGIIPEVLEMAKYSKYEHHSGTIYQINSLLECADNDLLPEEHHCPLIISSLFLHIGHFPFTFSSERALLLACNLDNKIKRKVEIKLEKIFKNANFDDKKQKMHISNLFNLKNYKNLYKYYSADFMIDS